MTKRKSQPDPESFVPLSEQDLSFLTNDIGKWDDQQFEKKVVTALIKEVGLWNWTRKELSELEEGFAEFFHEVCPNFPCKVVCSRALGGKIKDGMTIGTIAKQPHQVPMFVAYNYLLTTISDIEREQFDDVAMFYSVPFYPKQTGVLFGHTTIANKCSSVHRYIDRKTHVRAFMATFDEFVYGLKETGWSADLPEHV